jgi:chemotaxis protein methyltransferase CheR
MQSAVQPMVQPTMKPIPQFGHDGVAEADLETVLFLAALDARFGADFRGFKPAGVGRKLEDLVRRLGLSSISALQGEVLRNQSLGVEVIRVLSETAASSVGTPDYLMALRCAMVPVLRSAPWPAIWVADCSDAGLVILLLALLEEEGLAGRTQVFVTSASEPGSAMTDIAISGEQMDELEEQHRFSGGRMPLRSYFVQQDDGFALSPRLRAGVTCHAHDLSSDASFREFEAIVCARAWDEYGDALQQRALGVFGDSLCAFGLLQADFSNSGRCAPGEAFAPVLPAQGVFRRLPRWPLTTTTTAASTAGP